MTELKHTPGPWDWDTGLIPPDGPERYADVHAGDTVIASFNDRIPEGRANARLIAAAPELLEALEALSAVAEMTTFSDQCPAECEAARAAIAKATGSDQ